MYKNWGEVMSRVRLGGAPKRVVLAAAHDEHSLEAVRDVARDGLIRPILVGHEARIKTLCEKLGLDMFGVEIHHQPDPAVAASVSVSLINQGLGDFLMKGALETAVLLKAVVDKIYGLGCGRVMSHVALLEVPRYHKMLAVTDGGMIPHPTLEQKRDIVINAVGLLSSLGYEQPLVAALAGVEHVNPKMPETIDGDALKKMNQEGVITNCLVEGPISMDLSLSREKAAIKGYSSLVAGEADILVSPDLSTGNCVTKAMVEVGQAEMAGLIMGARVPVVVTSRASSAREKYLSLVLAAAGCGQGLDL
ncbi:phosphate butyryltransferase [Deltaproteobacteria bacterium Smac51]|nr:phosphate butyryltransferase [Deltaproteobacteria bacterium Smac51]